jgi:hypothetical protein
LDYGLYFSKHNALNIWLNLINLEHGGYANANAEEFPLSRVALFEVEDLKVVDAD